MSSPQSHQRILVVDHNQIVCGFVCMYLNKHQQYGTLIDNLHVAQQHQGKGVGTKLLHASVDLIAEQEVKAAMYLEVLADNHAAIRFYQSLGAKLVDSSCWRTPCQSDARVVDGRVFEARVLLYHWPSVAELAKRTRLKTNS